MKRLMILLPLFLLLAACDEWHAQGNPGDCRA